MDAGSAPPTLEVIRVLQKNLEATTRLQGELSAFEAVGIYARVPGFVEEVLVDRGSKVRSGQPLIRLSAPELAAQVAEAGSRAHAEASTFSRLKAAASTPGTVAGHELELAEANLQASQAHAQSVRALQGYLVLRAPFDGVISERNVHPGALVGGPTTSGSVPLLRLEQVERLRLTVAIPEADVGAIPEAATLEFSVQAWPGEKFQGRLERVSHAVELRTRTMAVELDVANADARLAPGMFAVVVWPLRRTAPSLFVPGPAVAQTPDRLYVDRIRDGVLEQVDVHRGAVVGTLLEVFGALQPGDWVLARASEELKNGARVQAKPASPPAASK